MRFKRIADDRSNVGPQTPKIFDRLRSQDDLEAHSGQIIARIYAVLKTVRSNAKDVRGGYQDIPHRAADRTIQWFGGPHFMSFSIVFSLHC